MKVFRYHPTQAIVSLVIRHWEQNPRSAGPHGPVRHVRPPQWEVITLPDEQVEVKHKIFDGSDERTVRRLYRREHRWVRQVPDEAGFVCTGLLSEGPILQILGDDSLETTIRRAIGLPTGPRKA